MEKRRFYLCNSKKYANFVAKFIILHKYGHKERQKQDRIERAFAAVRTQKLDSRWMLVLLIYIIYHMGELGALAELNMVAVAAHNSGYVRNEIYPMELVEAD